jgi:hypothetical protein
MRLAALLVVAMVSIAHADSEQDFRTAEEHAMHGDPHALDELEAIGRTRPITPWTDNAWSEAARLAERAGDYARARADLEQVVATTTDTQIARRARGDLARLAAAGGDAWAEVAAEHDRLEARIGADGDPRPALEALEALIARAGGYPRVADAMLAVAHGWEREGELDRSLGWYRRAYTKTHDKRATADLARALIRRDELAEAREHIAELHDPVLVADLNRRADRAGLRHTLRWSLAGLLLALAAAAAITLRIAAGSWRAAARRLVRPPWEVLYFAPVAVLLAIVAGTANPLVARAVRAIAIAGVIVAWLSGVLLEAQRTRGKLALPRVAIHIVLAVLATLSAAFLAVDHDRLFDLLAETWHAGPEPR